ncbi:MAG: L-2-hydroxyglutarate oxidase [Rhodothermales bacterium]|nr:L-2-hydroxyglutarate oxidase [Rhodothermales bacterium]
MKYDVAVIGGGIVGLATAYQITRLYPRKSVVLLEKEDKVATHQTGRNSGVIHSGIYYTPGSLKAENCREGRRALIDFCQAHDITYDICGKVIVAVEESEVDRLNNILARGQQNGINCRLIDADELRELEPHCSGIKGIHVPEAGIVDYVGVSTTLSRLINEHGCDVRTKFSVVGLAVDNNSVVVESSSGENVSADSIVNCAGLYADKIAKMSGDVPDIQVVPFRGEYYDLTPEARHLCKNLIYPVPDPAYPFLGVHFTRMHDGRVECGPSAIVAFAREGYTFGTVNIRELSEILTYQGFLRLSAKHWKKGISEIRQSLSKKYYLKVLQRLIPEVRLEDLREAPAGVRAQALRKDGTMVDDFLIKKKGRIINVYNAASPAATASLNIGKVIARYTETDAAA